MLGFLRKDSTEKLQQQAKANFEKLQELKGESVDVATFRLRLSSLCKAHIDKTFIDGAESTRLWQDASALAISNAKEPPRAPCPQYYHLVKVASSDNKVWTWIPEEYTDSIFNLGCKFQTVSIGLDDAISQTQVIADTICKEHLKLEKSFTVLDFLRGDEN